MADGEGLCIKRGRVTTEENTRAIVTASKSMLAETQSLKQPSGTSSKSAMDGYEMPSNNERQLAKVVEPFPAHLEAESNDEKLMLQIFAEDQSCLRQHGLDNTEQSNSGQASSGDLLSLEPTQTGIVGSEETI